MTEYTVKLNNRLEREVRVKAEYADVSESGALCFYNEPGQDDKTLKSVSGDDNLVRAFNSWTSFSKV